MKLSQAIPVCCCCGVSAARVTSTVRALLIPFCLLLVKRVIGLFIVQFVMAVFNTRDVIDFGLTSQIHAHTPRHHRIRRSVDDSVNKGALIAFLFFCAAEQSCSFIADARAERTAVSTISIFGVHSDISLSCCQTSIVFSPAVPRTARGLRFKTFICIPDISRKNYARRSSVCWISDGGSGSV